jgi:hypothetical protein
MQVAPAQAHGVVDVAALDVTTARAGGGRDTCVDASSVKKVVTVDEVTIRHAEIHVDRDCAELCPSIPALETVQSCFGSNGSRPRERVQWQSS